MNVSSAGIPPSPMIVTICGPSASGKSSVAKGVAALMGLSSASRVPVDWYIVPRDPAEPLAEYMRRACAYDWERLRRDLALPIGTVVTTPGLDFDSWLRCTPAHAKTFTVRSVMLLDAMQPYPFAHRTVVLQVADDVRQKRLALRDIEWGSDVRRSWDRLEETWGATAATVVSDLVIDNTQRLDQTVRYIATWIAREKEFWDRDGQP